MVHFANISTPSLDSVSPVPMVNPSTDAGSVVSLDPAETVVAKHTAVKTDGTLGRAYQLQSIRTGLPLACIDLVVSATSLVFASWLINLSQGHAFNPGTWFQLPALVFLQLGLGALHQLYPGSGISPVFELRGIVRSAAIACLCLCAMNILFGQLPRIEFAIFVLTAFLIASGLPLARYIARQSLAKTSWWGIRTLLIGPRSDCQRICRRMQNRGQSGFQLAGYVVTDKPVGFMSIDSQAGDVDDDPQCLGSVAQASAIARFVRTPVAALASSDQHALAARLMFQFPSLVWLGNAAAEEEPSDLLGPYTKRLNVPFLRWVPRATKRAVDLMICVPGLMILAVPMAIIGLLIKWQSPGPVIYGSQRVGQHGRRFKMWKFRSMVTNADEVLQQKLDSDPEARAQWDADSKLKNDPRIIAGIGHFLRRSSLDELPQLWNVLVGEMSLVGPRPVPPGEIVRYQNHYYEYTHMWPGITGLWQVSGRNETSFETRVFLVHHYAANWSIWLDVWILVKTPITVITRRGAY